MGRESRHSFVRLMETVSSYGRALGERVPGPTIYPGIPTGQARVLHLPCVYWTRVGPVTQAGHSRGTVDREALPDGRFQRYNGLTIRGTAYPVMVRIGSSVANVGDPHGPATPIRSNRAWNRGSSRMGSQKWSYHFHNTRLSVACSSKEKTVSRSPSPVRTTPAA